MGLAVTARELKKWLEGKGCTFSPGYGGHLVVELDGKTALQPMHGNDLPLGSGLVGHIKRSLGLDQA